MVPPAGIDRVSPGPAAVVLVVAGWIITAASNRTEILPTANLRFTGASSCRRHCDGMTVDSCVSAHAGRVSRAGHGFTSNPLGRFPRNRRLPESCAHSAPRTSGQARSVRDRALFPGTDSSDCNNVLSASSSERRCFAVSTPRICSSVWTWSVTAASIRSKSGLGERHEQAATICRIGASLDQPDALESVEAARQGCGRQHQRLCDPRRRRDIRRPEAAQCRQHIEVTQPKVVPLQSRFDHPSTETHHAPEAPEGRHGVESQVGPLRAPLLDELVDDIGHEHDVSRSYEVELFDIEYSSS